jgi:DNA invertase Pin-like site-specific DNA recombinase
VERTAWGYVRYSTDKQGRNSLERQVEALESWANRRGLSLLGISHDVEMSRTLAYGERPGLTGALDLVKSEHIDVLVGESVSRLAGDSVILAGIRGALPRWARLATADETGNEDLDDDRQEFEAFFSKREIKQIRQRTRGALAMKKLRGEAMGVLSYGFRLKANGSHVMRDRVRKCIGRAPDCAGCLHVEPDEGEQAIIRRVLALSAEGKTLQGILDSLTADQIYSRVGKPFGMTQIQRMIRAAGAARAA